MTDALIADLRRIVGRSGVLLGSDLATATVDHRGACRGEAAALVRPCSTEEVAAVVRLCARRSSKIVTQGGNTGLSGGATPTGHRTSVIVSLGRMNRIESLDPGRGSALVQAGVTIEALQQAAASVDRMFAPDWGARGSATIGGAISTNAGGINVLAFGTTREHVLGLEVVLADGRTWNGLRTLRKDSSGYDLKQLFIGAEGTLGIVTRAVVRLLPSATHQATAMAAIDSLGSLAPLLALAQDHAQGGLTAFELLPEMGVEAVVARHGAQRPLATRADWYVLVRFSGSAPVVDRLAAHLAEASARGTVIDAVVAATPEQEQNLWLIRDGLSPPSLFDGRVSALKTDTAVPVDVVATHLTRCHAAVAEIAPDSVPCSFGHVGDGNIHMHVLVPADQEDRFLEVRPRLRARLDEITWELGGTISAEHGVGRELRERIAGQKSPVEIELMRRVKDMLDSDGLLNPGKTLPAG